jgi:hypothetical protein
LPDLHACIIPEPTIPVPAMPLNFKKCLRSSFIRMIFRINNYCPCTEVMISIAVVLINSDDRFFNSGKRELVYFPKIGKEFEFSA